MAKKPVIKQTQGPKITVIVRNYASEIAELKETIHDPNLDLGYRFFFPNRKHPMHKIITIVKPNKKKYIQVGTGLKISGPHKECIEKLDDEKKKNLFFEFQKIFFSKEVQFTLDFKNLRYGFHKFIYLDKEEKISKSDLLETMEKIFNTAMLTIILLEQFCDEKIDFSKRSFGPSMYT